MPWYSAGYQLPARLANSGQAMPHEMTAPIIMEMFTASGVMKPTSTYAMVKSTHQPAAYAYKPRFGKPLQVLVKFGMDCTTVAQLPEVNQVQKSQVKAPSATCASRLACCFASSPLLRAIGVLTSKSC